MSGHKPIQFNDEGTHVAVLTEGGERVFVRASKIMLLSLALCHRRVVIYSDDGKKYHVWNTLKQISRALNFTALSGRQAVPADYKMVLDWQPNKTPLIYSPRTEAYGRCTRAYIPEIDHPMILVTPDNMRKLIERGMWMYKPRPMSKHLPAYLPTHLSHPGQA